MRLRKIIFYSLILLGFILVQQDSFAQCAMCKATVESNIENTTNNVGRGLNTGILYLMLIPYLILGSIFFFSFKKQIIGFMKSLSAEK